MNTEHLKYLLVVNNCQSINRAAEQLHLQHSYLSKVIATLEQQLGTTIFTRNSKGVVLTSNGEKIIEQAKVIVSAVDKMLNLSMTDNEIYPEYFDEITITFPGHLRVNQHLTSIILEFKSIFPNVSAQLISQKIIPSIPNILQNNMFLCFALNSDLAKNFNKALPEDIRFLPLKDYNFVALASKQNLVAAKYQSISLKTLCKQNLALLNSNTDKDSFMFNLLSTYSPTKIKFVASKPEILYQVLKQTDYFSIGLQISEDDPDIRQIPLRDNLYVKYGVFFNKKAPDNFVMRALINTILQYYKLPLL